MPPRTLKEGRLVLRCGGTQEREKTNDLTVIESYILGGSRVPVLLITDEGGTLRLVPGLAHGAQETEGGDGRFACAGLRPGKYKLYPEYVFPESDRAEPSLRRDLLAEVKLAAGEVRDFVDLTCQPSRKALSKLRIARERML